MGNDNMISKEKFDEAIKIIADHYKTQLEGKDKIIERLYKMDDYQRDVIEEKNREIEKLEEEIKQYKGNTE